jgi:hypothetical protein
MKHEFSSLPVQNRNMRTFRFYFVLVLLLLLEVAGIYFIMPFPGSQRQNSLDLAYWLFRNTTWIRGLLLVLLVLTAYQLFRQSSRKAKWIAGISLGIYAVVLALIQFQMRADKMFLEPRQLQLENISKNSVTPEKLIIGVVVNGEARAYPIQFIGYHHQVRDKIGDSMIMVTYCTVCHSGRVFSPLVAGLPETFRLVGMDHFNAMFEDEGTKSWWRQATGEAVAGPLKGQKLSEIPSQQMSLGAWLRNYPNSLIMQPDSSFKEEYADLIPYEKGQTKSSLTKRDSLSWQDKSWVVGINIGLSAKAFDWNELLSKQMLKDSLEGIPFALVVEKDSSSYHAWDLRVGDRKLDVSLVDNRLVDQQTGSSWNFAGWCTEGPLKGTHLQPVPAYQEYWHSWKTFHPQTRRFPGN